MFKEHVKEMLAVELQKLQLQNAILGLTSEYLESKINCKYSKRIAKSLEAFLEETTGKEITVLTHVDRGDVDFVRLNISTSIYPNDGETHRFSGLVFLSLKFEKHKTGFPVVDSFRTNVYDHQLLLNKKEKDVLLAIEKFDDFYNESRELDKKISDLYNRVPSCLKHLWTVRDMCLNICE